MKNPGQLYLGVFSGPVEGILLIVIIFIMTGFYGALKSSNYCGQALNVVQDLRSGIKRY